MSDPESQPYSLRWRYFPPTEDPPAHLEVVVAAFEAAATWLADYVAAQSGTDGRAVAQQVEQHFSSASEWHLEGVHGQVRMPVVRGENGQALSRVEPDGLFEDVDGRVSSLEIEGGGALQNNRLMKDLFEALLLPQVDYVVIAVPQKAHKRSPFDFAVNLVSAIQ